MNKVLQSALLNFWGKVFILLFPIYWIHLYIYSFFEITIDVYVLQLSYIVNGLLAVLIYTVLLLLKNKFNDQLGFLYMLGSFLKFAAFFIVFYPIFNDDGEINKIEFSIFFIPYLISLLIETLDLIKILNSGENKEN